MRICTLFLLASALMPTQAVAQESVLVMDIAVDDTQFQAAGELVTDQLREGIAAVRGWDLSPTRTTLDAERRRHGCRDGFTDHDCLAAIAADAGVGHLVFGRLRARVGSPGEFTIELQHYEVAAGRFVGSTFRSLRVEGIDTADAELLARIQTILGEDDLRIMPRAPVSTASTRPRPTGPPNRDLTVGFGIASLAVGALFLGGATVSWVAMADLGRDSDFQAYRQRVPMGSATDVCAEARADRGWERGQVSADVAAAQTARVRTICSDAASLEVWEWVLPLASAAFVGLGIGLLLFDPGPGEPQVTVTPRVGLSHAGLSISVAF